MTTNNQDQNEVRKQSPEKPSGKRAYHKPTYRYERVFETSALSCGKVNATQTSCTLNRKLS
jgi:hypothetical protein